MERKALGDPKSGAVRPGVAPLPRGSKHFRSLTFVSNHGMERVSSSPLSLSLLIAILELANGMDRVVVPLSHSITRT